MIQADAESNLPIDGGLQQKNWLAWQPEVAAESETRRGERKVRVRALTAIGRQYGGG
uniref:Uncharacterized protein n=1 Tax=Cucumis melo TaxID=3656 RepID=A0A9I9D8C9_CUCME